MTIYDGMYVKTVLLGELTVNQMYRADE